MGGDELIERGGGYDQHRSRHLAAPSCAPHLLPKTCDCARVSGDDGGSQLTDIDPQLQCIRRHYTENITAPQPSFDFPAFERQISAPIATYRHWGAAHLLIRIS